GWAPRVTRCAGTPRRRATGCWPCISSDAPPAVLHNARVGFVDVAGVRHVLPDGRVLFADVSFRVGEGAKVALVGPNGAGKTTLLSMVAGDLPVRTGTVARAGGLGVMRQFIGMIGDETTLAAMALGLAEPRLRAAGERVAH